MGAGPGRGDLASLVALAWAIGALDALHLATFRLARRRLERLELLAADERPEEAASST